MLCGEDEETATRAIKALVPDTPTAAAGRTNIREVRGSSSDLMDSALMLRKLQAAALAATGEGARRARLRLEDAGKALEHACILRFDEASARCDKDAAGSAEEACALLDMRAAADALLYYNGGMTVMQRYVSTRRPFIDPEVVMGDRQRVEEVTCAADALAKVEYLIDDMLVFLQAESRRLPHVFAKHDAVMLMLVERLCYERLAPMVQGVVARLYVGEVGGGEAEVQGKFQAQNANDDRLDCKVKILEACARLLARLESGAGDSGPLAHKEAREEVADMLDNMLAPYVDEFVPEQLQLLTRRLAVYLPLVSAQDHAEYVVDVEEDEDPAGSEAGASQEGKEEASEAGVGGSEDEGGGGMRDQQQHGDGKSCPPAARGGARGALAWAARKRQDLSASLHLPAKLPKRPAVALWRSNTTPASRGSPSATARLGSATSSLVISVANVAAAGPTRSRRLLFLPSEACARLPLSLRMSRAAQARPY